MGGASTEARTAGARAITRRVLRVLHWGAARPIDVLHVPNRRPAKVVRLRALWLRVLHLLRVLRVRPLRLLRPLEFERQGRGDVARRRPEHRHRSLLRRRIRCRLRRVRLVDH